MFWQLNSFYCLEKKNPSLDFQHQQEYQQYNLVVIRRKNMVAKIKQRSIAETQYKLFCLYYTIMTKIYLNENKFNYIAN